MLPGCIFIINLNIGITRIIYGVIFQDLQFFCQSFVFQHLIKFFYDLLFIKHHKINYIFLLHGFTFHIIAVRRFSHLPDEGFMHRLSRFFIKDHKHVIHHHIGKTGQTMLFDQTQHLHAHGVGYHIHLQISILVDIIQHCPVHGDHRKFQPDVLHGLHQRCRCSHGRQGKVRSFIQHPVQFHTAVVA